MSLFTAYFPDIIFKHLYNIIMYLSCYKMEKQAIPHAIIVIVKLYRGVDYSRHLMGRHIGIEDVSKQPAPIFIDWHISILAFLVP